jgi:hypothetical protein
MAADPLIGKHFYLFAPKEQHPDAPVPVVECAGQVRSRVRDGLYLVRLINWLTGQFERQVLVTLDKMNGWTFYDDPDAWRDWYADQYDPAIRGYFERRPEARK